MFSLDDASPGCEPPWDHHASSNLTLDDFKMNDFKMDDTFASRAAFLDLVTPATFGGSGSSANAAAI